MQLEASARRLPAPMLGGVILSLIFLAVDFYLSNTMNWPDAARWPFRSWLRGSKGID